MTITEFADHYYRKNGIARTPVYSANRFARLIGDLKTEEITEKHLDQFVQKCRSEKLSEWTIKGGVKDIRTLIHAETGKLIKVPKLKSPQPDPRPVSLSSINSCWPHCEAWLKQWIALSYWTGLRLADVVRLQRSDCSKSPIVIIANKTGHIHRIPVRSG